MNEQAQFAQIEVAPTVKQAVKENLSQDEQIRAIINFADYLTSRYPQLDMMRVIQIGTNNDLPFDLPPLPDSLQIEPQLNYYLVGSLATTLLSRADIVELCAETADSDIKVESTITIPEQSRRLLAEFARPIGDIDYVPTAHYKRLRNRVVNSYGRVSNEEYQSLRAKYLWKGGGLKFAEIPQDSRLAVKRGTEQNDDFGIMCDPVETYGTKKFARITIGEKEYFIARPDTIIAYKVLHMLESFDQKPEKFNADFAKMYVALKGMYSNEQLLELTHSTLHEYEKNLAEASAHHEPKLPTMISRLLDKNNLGEEARYFITDLVYYDKHHGNLLSSQSPPISTEQTNIVE